MTCAHAANARPRGFSLVELVVVVVIIGIIAAIAVPRMSSAAARSKFGALRANLATLNRAVDLYTIEHGGLHPAQDKTGALTDGDQVIVHLLEKTDEFGSPASIFGPYLLRMPLNPFNGLATVRVDGAPAGAGTHGWRFNSARRVFVSDGTADAVVDAAVIEAEKIGVDAAAAALDEGK